MIRFGCLVFAACITICHWAEPLAGQAVGDRIVITSNFDTKIQSTKVGKVYGGSINTIMRIQGKWCMVEGVRGWLPTQFTMDLKTAQKLYERRVGTDKRDYDAYSVLGMIAYEKGESSKAIEYLNSALKANSKVATIWNNRAIVLSDVGRFDEAKRDLNEALKLNANYASAHGNLGLIHIATGESEKAIESFTKAIRLAQSNPTHYKNRGSAHHSLGNLDKALADFDSALRIDRLYSKAYMGKANVYLARENLRAAEDNAREAVRLDARSPLAHNNLGWILYRRGKVDQAIECFNRSIKLNQQMAIALSNRGIALVSQKKFDAAISDFNKALRIDQKSPVVLSNRAGAWQGKKNFEKAMADHEAAFELAPEMTDVLNAFAWFLATCPEEKFRDSERAIKLIRVALEKSGETGELLDTYAAALAGNDDFAAAVEKQSSAVKLSSSESKAEYESRLELYKQGKPFRSELGKN